MNIFKNLKFLASTAVMLMGLGAAAHAQSSTVTFDNVTAPQFFFQVTSGGPDGPTFVTPEATFTGGVVLTNFFGVNEATSGTNVYVTSFPSPNPFPNNAEIDNGTTPLPGSITGTLTTPGKFTNVSLDLIGAMPNASTVTFTLLDASNAVIATETVPTDGYNSDPTLANDITHLSLSGAGISSFLLTTPNTVPNQVGEFAIDTVVLSTPEPSEILGMAIGGAILAGMIVFKRRKTVSSLNS